MKKFRELRRKLRAYIVHGLRTELNSIRSNLKEEVGRKGMPVNHFYKRDGGQLWFGAIPIRLLSPRLVDIAHLTGRLSSSKGS
ncbi:hypothetical protein HAX54_023374 [Datura stramonium]|uniref:Uncharacterized protein n=1 Tax=Datura stramonium TaxID=4076 RepID=A0ABS8S5P5_DATST|nr:hypothetical protein [Datura stramonium]